MKLHTVFLGHRKFTGIKRLVQTEYGNEYILMNKEGWAWLKQGEKRDNCTKMPGDWSSSYAFTRGGPLYKAACRLWASYEENKLPDTSTYPGNLFWNAEEMVLIVRDSDVYSKLYLGCEVPEWQASWCYLTNPELDKMGYRKISVEKAVDIADEYGHNLLYDIMGWEYDWVAGFIEKAYSID